jgi:predicted nucleic acid-binding protein
MRAIVDTTVWSLAYRRQARALSGADADALDAFRELLNEGRCVLLGLVRQEILQGIRDPGQFDLVRADLDEFPDEPVFGSDHVRAAQLYNRCRSRGVQPTTIDMLICAVASRLKATVFTDDGDFAGYHRVLGTRLFRPVSH